MTQILPTVAEQLAEATDDWGERCGVEMGNGDPCDRPADDCPYH